MHWERLDRISPPDGTICVVAHFVQGMNRPATGVLKYCYSGHDSYWVTKHGGRIPCCKYDNWCDVDDIINAVEERIEDDISSVIDRQKLMNGDYDF